ncbi:MAG: hypothetical protein AAGA54_05245 [Myxococcota bacterium]
MDFGAIITLVKAFFGPLFQLKKTRKEEVAAYLDEIAVALEKVPAGIRNGEPFEKLMGVGKEVAMLAEKFDGVTKDVLDADERAEFVSLLQQASNAKVLLVSAGTLDGGQEKLATIADAIGAIRGVATSLRGSASQLVGDI